MSDRVTLPLNAALTGPIRRRTLAVISVSESFSSDSQPGMQAFSTSASFSAANTFSRGASIRYSPLISIGKLLVLPLAGIGVRRRFCQRFAQGDIDRREVRNGHHQRQEAEPVGLGVPEQGADHPAPAVGRHEAARPAVVELDRA